MAPTTPFSVARRIVFIANVNLDWTEDQLRGSVYQHTSVHVNRMQRVMEGYFFDCDSSADAAAVVKGMAGRQMLRQGRPVSAVTLDGADTRTRALAARYVDLPQEAGRYGSYWARKSDDERVPEAAPASAPQAPSSSYWDLAPSEPKEVAARRREERHRRGSQAPSSDSAQPYEDFVQRPDAGALYRAHLPGRWQAGQALVPLTAAELARTAPQAPSPTARSPPAPAYGSDGHIRHPLTHIKACHHLYAGGLPQTCAWQDLKDFARMHCDQVGYATVLPGHHGALRGLLSFYTKEAQADALMRLDGISIHGVIPKWGKMHLAEWDMMELEVARSEPATAPRASPSSPPLLVAPRSWGLSHAAYQAASQAYWPHEERRRDEARSRGEPEFTTGSNTEGLGRPNRYGASRTARTPDVQQPRTFVASPERLPDGYSGSSKETASVAAEASQSSRRRHAPDPLNDGAEGTGTKRRRLARAVDEYDPAQPWIRKSASPGGALHQEQDDAVAGKGAADESGIALCPSSPVAGLPLAASDAHASTPRAAAGAVMPLLSALNAPLSEPLLAEAAAPAASSSSAFMTEIANIFAEECGDLELSLRAATGGS